MECEVLGWPDDEVTLDLDHRSFSYAGKFVMSTTGKAVVRDNDRIIAAASFGEDRTDEEIMWIRYVTVHADRRGHGIGSRLGVACRETMLDAGYRAVRMAVNNPFAYQAFTRSGFGYTGRTTGLAELVLATNEPVADRYRAGLLVFSDRSDLSMSERELIDTHLETGPPSQLELPIQWDGPDASP